jgi:hypothetical protein
MFQQPATGLPAAMARNRSGCLHDTNRRLDCLRRFAFVARSRSDLVGRWQIVGRIGEGRPIRFHFASIRCASFGRISRAVRNRRDRWPAQHEWLLSTAPKLAAVIRPFVMKIDASALKAAGDNAA